MPDLGKGLVEKVSVPGWVLKGADAERVRSTRVIGEKPYGKKGKKKQD